GRAEERPLVPAVGGGPNGGFTHALVAAGQPDVVHGRAGARAVTAVAAVVAGGGAGVGEAVEQFHQQAVGVVVVIAHLGRALAQFGPERLLSLEIRVQGPDQPGRIDSPLFVDQAAYRRQGVSGVGRAGAVDAEV